MQFLLQAFHEVVFRSIKERKFGVTYIYCMPLSDQLAKYLLVMKLSN